MTTTTKPTRQEYAWAIFREFGAVHTKDARGLTISVASEKVDALIAQATALGLDPRDRLVVGERAQVRIFGFPRLARPDARQRRTIWNEHTRCACGEPATGTTSDGVATCDRCATGGK